MSQRFDFIETRIAGLLICQRKPIVHDLGSFVRTFCADEFREAGLHKPIAQMNQTFTRKIASLRGLHFQHPPYAEIKVVSCFKGEVFDVAVDLRAGSPTFLQWHGEILSATNNKSMYIPEGLAHGFQTLTNDCDMFYLHTAPYSQQSEAGLHPLDPTIAIKWPLSISEISSRDKSHPIIDNAFIGLKI